MSKQLKAAVPDTADIFNYITALQNTATAAGVSVTATCRQPACDKYWPTLRHRRVQMDVTGTYDATLAVNQGPLRPAPAHVDRYSQHHRRWTDHESEHSANNRTGTHRLHVGGPNGSHRLAAGDYKIQERAIE